MFKNLFEEHKAERRQRILAAARRLIARGGFERMTMRDLAVGARVSVPTVYNLIGSKQALLLALLEEQVMGVARALGAAPPGKSFVDRVWALCRAGHDVLLEAPAYTRGLVHLMLTNPESAPIRHDLDARHIEMMAGILRTGQAGGELEPWIDPTLLSGTMYTIYIATLIRWAQGEIDSDELRSFTTLGTALVLSGVARGPAAEQLHETIRLQQKRAARSRTPREKGA